MTVTLPSSGMTAHRRGRSPGDAARRLLRAGIAALTVVGLTLTGSAVASAAASTPSPEPTAQAEPSGVVALTLSPVSNGIVDDGDPLAVSFTVTNDTTVTEPAMPLSLQLGARPLTTRSALATWLAGDTTGVSTREVATATADPVEPAGSTTVGAVVPATDDAIADLGPGVYPLVARGERPGGEVVSTSVMIVPRATVEATPVGVIVPITAGALTTGLLTAAQLETMTAAGGELREALDAVAGTPTILAVDPAIPAAIRVLGDAAPADAVAWLDELMGLPNPRFALQFGDADVAAQLAGGLPAPLQPTSLAAYMASDNFPTPTATPEPTPEPDDRELPSLEELLDIGTARAGVYWPAGGTADAAIVETLGGLGTEEEPTLTLIPSATTAPATATVPARTQVGGAATLTYDTGISTALLDASTTPIAALRGRSLASAVGMLELASAQGVPLLVTVDRATARSRLALRSAIDAATALESTRAAMFSELVGATPQNARITTAEPDAARADAASTMHAEEADIAAFATILDDPDLLTGPQRAEVLQVLGNAWIPQPVEWETALAAHHAATVDTLDSVGILPPSNINLATSGSSLPFWVRNDLPYPVNVVLYAIPDDLRLDVRRATRVDGAEGGSNTKVLVPVQSRVGNGDVTIQLQLRSATSVPIGAARFVDVNVRADWEGIGVAVILALVAGFIALGLVRTILRRRGVRKARDAAAAADADAAGAPGAALDAESGPGDAT